MKIKLGMGKRYEDESVDPMGWGNGDGDLGNFDDNIGNFDGMTDETPADPQAAPAGYGSNGGIEMKIYTPKSVDDCEEIASLLLSGKTILLNLEALSGADVVRLMDYLRGATYMVDGNITRATRTSIVVSPKNVDISVIEAMTGGVDAEG